MNNFGFKQIFGGISVMFSVLFLLAIASNMQGMKSLSTSLMEDIDTNLAKPLDPYEEQANPPVPDNVVHGSFQLEARGDVAYQDPNDGSRSKHFKALRSDKLKSPGVKPTLKMELSRDGKYEWTDVPWEWIDYDQGIIYFHYLNEANGSTSPTNLYTGNYQILF